MNLRLINQAITILTLFGFLLPSFSFAQVPIETPETMEEAKEMEKKALEVSKKELPGILEKIWKEEVLPVWQKMWKAVSNWWNNTAWPKIKGFFKQKVEPPVKEEIEKRKPIIEEEFKKEKEEIKEELPKVGKSLWERFKELIK